MASQRAVHQLVDCFRKIVHALRSSHRAAGQLHLTGAQLYVVKILGDAAQPLTIGEVAERTLTDQSTVSVVATRLADHGLVERNRSEKDSRRVYLVLTAKGRATYRRAPGTIASKRLIDALSRFTPAEAEALHSMLGHVVKEIGAGRSRAGMFFDDEEEEPARQRRTG